MQKLIFVLTSLFAVGCSSTLPYQKSLSNLVPAEAAAQAETPCQAMVEPDVPTVLEPNKSRLTKKMKDAIVVTSEVVFMPVSVVLAIPTLIVVMTTDATM